MCGCVHLCLLGFVCFVSVVLCVVGCVCAVVVFVCVGKVCVVCL